MQPIFVYHDYAHHNAALWFALTRRYANVRYVDANDILKGVLNEQPAAFIMPGGASRYAGQQLRGAGNIAIKRYVEGGGKYIGICGGAYYGSRKVQWQHGTQNFDVSYDLRIADVDTKGPITPFCQNEAASSITTLTTASGQRPALYIGGPQFINISNDATVLAHYAELPTDNAAVITGSCGNGHYLLCSPHLEFDDAALNLMQFDVVDNRYADLAKLPRTPGMTLEYFYELLDAFLGT